MVLNALKENGIICFQFDVNGDASRFSKIFVMEFGEVEGQ